MLFLPYCYRKILRKRQDFNMQVSGEEEMKEEKESDLRMGKRQRSMED